MKSFTNKLFFMTVVFFSLFTINGFAEVVNGEQGRFVIPTYTQEFKKHTFTAKEFLKVYQQAEVRPQFPIRHLTLVRTNLEAASIQGEILGIGAHCNGEALTYEQLKKGFEAEFLSPAPSARDPFFYRIKETGELVIQTNYNSDIVGNVCPDGSKPKRLYLLPDLLLS